jgi:hypothetical protein
LIKNSIVSLFPLQLITLQQRQDAGMIADDKTASDLIINQLPAGWWLNDSSLAELSVFVTDT